LVIFASAIFAACGGNVSSVPLAGRAVPTPSPSSSASTQSQPVTSPFSLNVPLAIPSVGGFSGTIVIPNGSTIAAGSMITLQSFIGEPSGGPTLQSVSRKLLDLTPEAVCSLQAIFNYSETLSGIPGVSVSGPGISAAAQYFAELFDTTTGDLAGSSPGSVVANTVTFASGTTAIPVVANRPYLIVVVTGSQLASPSPSPTASQGATSTPTPPAVVSISEVTSPGQLSGLTISPSGVPYYVDQITSAIGYVSGGGVVELPIAAPSPAPLYGVFGVGGFAWPAFGPDGNIWFPHSYTNSITRMNPITGAYTDFPIPTASAWPDAVVAGPDGAMWFTEFYGKIGRITTSGAITEMAVPAGTNAYIEQIVTGPDGALWFVETGAGKLGRIPTTATPGNPSVTEFPMANPGCVNLSLTSGPLNSLWYVGCSGSLSNITIDQVSTSGVQTYYPIPASFKASDPRFVTTGTDGAIWFTDQNSNYIGRLAPNGNGTGTFSQYPYPLVHAGCCGNASAASIMPAPDGSLWWVEFNTGNIGHLQH
jgi:virginiamycin B lyase